MVTPVPPLPSASPLGRVERVSTSDRAPLGLATPDLAQGVPGAGPSATLTAQAQIIRAVSAAAGAAASRQAGLAPLLADLAQALLSPNLPPQVRAAAAQLATLRTALGPEVSGAELKQALSQSGLFLEAQLARVAVVGAQPPAMDLKAALLTLQQALRAWPEAATSGPRPTRSTRREPPPPPYAGGPTSGQRAATASLSPHDDAPSIAGALLAETGAALARQELMQIASMPSGAEPQSARWMFEIPFITPQGSAVAQFEVSRDGERASGATPERAPVWRARFAIDAEPMGPVQALLVLNGEKAGVTLWAERVETAQRLRTRAARLTEALGRAAFEAELMVHVGTPPGLSAPAGKFVDRAL